MKDQILRALIRDLIAESTMEDINPGTLEYIRRVINTLGERLRGDRAAVVGKLRMRLEFLGQLAFPGDPMSGGWDDFRDRLTRALIDLGVDWGIARGLTGWAGEVRPPPDPVPPRPVRQITPAPPDAPFGRYAWASQRQGVPSERDNSLEKRIARLIKRHVEDNIPLRAENFKLMMDLVNQGLYSDILMKPEPDALLYRGMHVSEAFIETLGLDPETVEDGDHSLGVVVNPAPPRRGAYVSSWTRNRDIADNFKSTGGNSGFSVVLIARAGDNPDSFLDCQVIVDELGSIEGDVDQSSEEVFCGGRVRLSGVEIINNSRM